MLIVLIGDLPLPWLRSRTAPREEDRYWILASSDVLEVSGKAAEDHLRTALSGEVRIPVGGVLGTIDAVA